MAIQTKTMVMKSLVFPNSHMVFNLRLDITVAGEATSYFPATGTASVLFFLITQAWPWTGLLYTTVPLIFTCYEGFCMLELLILRLVRSLLVMELPKIFVDVAEIKKILPTCILEAVFFMDET